MGCEEVTPRRVEGTRSSWLSPLGWSCVHTLLLPTPTRSRAELATAGAWQAAEHAQQGRRPAGCPALGHADGSSADQGRCCVHSPDQSPADGSWERGPRAGAAAESAAELASPGTSQATRRTAAPEELRPRSPCRTAACGVDTTALGAAVLRQPRRFCFPLTLTVFPSHNRHQLGHSTACGAAGPGSREPVTAARRSPEPHVFTQVICKNGNTVTSRPQVGTLVLRGPGTTASEVSKDSRVPGTPWQPKYSGVGLSREPAGDLRAVPTRHEMGHRPAVSSRARRCPRNPSWWQATADQRGRRCRDRRPLHGTGRGAGPTGTRERVFGGHGRRLGHAAGGNRGLILEQVLSLLGAVSGPLQDGELPSGSRIPMLPVKGGASQRHFAPANGASTPSPVCVKT